MNTLRTIEEENEIRLNSPVIMSTFTIEARYEPTGIQSPFHGEILEEVNLPHWNGERAIKCSKSGVLGVMKTECSVQAPIEWVEWDVEFKKTILYTKINCLFGRKSDLENKKFKMDNERRIKVKNKYGEYVVDVDIRDLKGFVG